MKKLLVFGSVLFLCACGSSKKVTTVKTNKPVNTNTRKEVNTTPSKKMVKEVEKVVAATQKNTKSHLNATTLSYVEKYAPLAMNEMQKFGIPASITLAQGILESGSGKSQLSSKSNNHFGIKCHKGWKGKRVYHDDDAKGECFRKYKYPATSYQDHSLFLSTRFRYASLFKLKKDDYKRWAKGLKKAGYATDPRYPNKLISFIEKYELYKYDQLVLKGKVSPIKAYKEKKGFDQNLAVKTASIYKGSKSTHQISGDDTLYSISKKYGISVSELKEINSLSSNTIHKGEVLKLKKNAKRKGYHIVKPKETLYGIAKEYKLSVSELKRLNRLSSNELSIGQSLRIE